MPLYEYLCGGCNAQFEVVQSFHDEPLLTCTSCNEDALARILFPPTFFDADPKTLGGQADKNSGPGRSYWLDKQRHDAAANAPPAAERPYWRDSDKIDMRLASLTPKEQTNYIMTGKTTDALTPTISST